MKHLKFNSIRSLLAPLGGLILTGISCSVASASVVAASSSHDFDAFSSNGQGVQLIASTAGSSAHPAASVSFGMAFTSEAGAAGKVEAVSHTLLPADGSKFTSEGLKIGQLVGHDNLFCCDNNIPEPSTSLLSILGGTVLVFRRKRR